MDYDRGTRDHYKDDSVAAAYHRAFTANLSFKNFRFRAVARRESAAVARLLRLGSHGRIVDIPAGSGKLAQVFKRLDAGVCACDVSANMLAIARQVYAELGYAKVEFMVADASDFVAQTGRDFDAVVCLRLLHRVPSEMRHRILAEIACAAPRAIVSFGVENRFHRVRRRLRAKIMGGGDDRFCFDSLSAVQREFSQYFKTDRTLWVIPGVSQEIIFHGRSRAYRA